MLARNESLHYFACMNLECEILIIGAGAVGLSAGLALAQAGRKVIIAGKIDTSASARTVALFGASQKFFDRLGLLDSIRQTGELLEVMRIIDDTGSLFRLPETNFRASEIGHEEFGTNIENRDLLDLLATAARHYSHLTVLDDYVTQLKLGTDHIEAELGADRKIIAKLILAADGRQSPTRQFCKIASTEQSYPQVAITALLGHQRPHNNVSTEFHTRKGPFTLVPLPAKGDQPHRSSLVWMTDPQEARRLLALPSSDLTRAMEKQAHSLLGKFTLLGAMSQFPMSLMRAERLYAERVVLIGDAAHSFPPIGAQGLNLGLRDVGHSVETILAHSDPGQESVLRAYAERRTADIKLRSFGVDLLNRSLLTQMLPMDFARGAGLLALSQIGPLRRMIMREGIEPKGRTPMMMR
jgi:2-octaprenyl-6-methoxyphenol hydroxylase